MAQTPAPSTLPQGGVVTQGQAQIASGNSVLDVNQSSQRATIHWDSFNLGAGATVNFNQPNAQAATLNRVQDMNPSQIFGRINAPGQVTLINPAGVYFSPSAVLDVGALTATTMNQTDADFMAGLHRFSRDGSTGAVVNQGTLRAGLGGYIALLAPQVRNEGLIVAQQGTVALAAGEAITLNFDPASGLAGLTVSPSQIATLVANRTAIQANDGLVILSSTAFGQLVGSLVNSGSVSASSMTAKGGRIVLEGDNIALQAGSVLGARGATGGGTVLVGGDWQGSGSLHQATTVTMDADARIDASATQSGDGGKVVLWSDVNRPDSATRAYGSILAQGGPSGGNGGQIETSGHWLDVNGIHASASAPMGMGGEWLLDPFNITIASSGATGTPYSANYTAGADSTILASSIVASLDGGTSVTVATGVGGAATGGDILVNASINKTAGGNATLTLRAHNNIAIDAGVGITSTSGALGVVLNSDYDGSGLGAINLLGGSSIRSNGGNITLGGGTAGDGSGDARGTTDSNYGIRMAGASIDAGGGNIQMRGVGWTKVAATQGGPVGVGLTFGSSVSTTGAGTITLDGVGGAGNGITNEGLYFGSSTLSTTAGAITLLGTGGNSTGDNNPGVYVDAGTQITTTGGSISITGTGNGNGTTTFENYGVRVSGGSLVAAGGSGNLTITGNSGTGTTTGFDGVLLGDAGSTLRTNAGNLTVTGISNAAGGSSSRGIHSTGATVVETTGGGNISLTGTGASGGTQNDGIYVDTGAQIRTTAGGNITLVGNNTGGTDANGVYLGAATISTSNATGGTVSLQGSSLSTGAAGTLGAVNLDSNAVVAANGAVAITGDANGQSGPYGVRLGANAAVSSNNNAITITTDSYAGSGSASVSAGSDNLTLRNLTAGTRIDLGGNDVQTGSPRTLGLDSAELNQLTAGTLVIGRNDGSAAGDVTVSGNVNPAGTGNLAVLTGGNMAINANLGVANTLVLSAGSGRTASGNGNLSASKLLLDGAGASYVLNTAPANAVSTLSATGVAALSFLNNGALTVGTVNGVNGIGASGAVSVATASGDLTLTQNVATTDASAAALLLNAGQSSAAGDSGGGNLMFAGAGAVGVGAGGRATLMSGSVVDSAGLTALVGAGSGRFRYNSDESAANYSTALGSGSYAIYRERPVITLTAASDSKTYDKVAYSGGNGVTYAGTLLNGDTLSGSLVYGGSAQGAVNAGSYAIAPGGQGSGQGYVMNYVDGTLTINRAALTVSTSNTTKPYDGTTTATGVATVTGGTLFGGDTLSGGTYVYTDENAGTNKTVDVSGVTLNDGNGGGNYTVTYQANTTSSITPKVLTATATAADKVYDGTTSASTTLVISGLVGTETLGSTNTSSFNSKDVATANLVTVNSAALQDGANGGLASNYVLDPGQTAPAHITAKTLTATATAADKVYDGTTHATATLVLSGLVGTETLGSTNTSSFNSKDVATASLVTVNSAALQDGANGGLAGNYVLDPGQTAPAHITAKTLTATATAADKVYDGTTTATATLVLSGLVGTETLGSTSTSSFNSKDVATANMVTVNGAALVDGGNGGLAGNYVLDPGQTAPAHITPRPLTVDFTGVDKVYDGTTKATVITSDDRIANDLLNVGTTARFVDIAVGKDKPVDVSNVLLTGADASNYVLARNSGTTTASITPMVVPLGSFDNLLVAPIPAPAPLTRDAVQTRVAQADLSDGRYAKAVRQPYLPPDDDGLVVTQLRDVDTGTIGLVRVDVGTKLLQRGSFEFALPTQAVKALRGALQSTATLPDGAPLQDWLRYDAKALKFRAEGAQPTALPLQTMVRAGSLRVLVDIDEMK